MGIKEEEKMQSHAARGRKSRSLRCLGPRLCQRVSGNKSTLPSIILAEVRKVDNP